MINETLCNYASRDTFTIILNFWVTLQLVWVTMLCVVQLVQISRNQTTSENMRSRHIDQSNPSSQAFASAMTAGTTSMETAGFSAAGQGPNPALGGPPAPRRKQGCIAQWSSLLGVDIFLSTAKDGLRDGPRAARPRNPFSRGVVTNCRDFWCDPAPLFGKRESGAAMLGGEVVNYHRMYEPPMRMHNGRSEGSGYRSVANEDPERLV